MSIWVDMLPVVMQYTERETYRAIAFTCKCALPHLEHRKYVLLSEYSHAKELESIESIRSKTDHDGCHGDLVCEVCLGAADSLSGAWVVMIDILSLPWLPHELEWSPSLENFVVDNWNEVAMDSTCADCRCILRNP